MNLFKKCEHNFIKDKNNLYCSKCGKHIRMKCDHQWEEINRSIVINGFGKKQIVSTRECQICGNFTLLNLITGEIK